MNYYKNVKNNKTGSLVILVLVFSAVFLTIISSLTGFVLIQKKLHSVKESRERAIQIAEAGLDYYKWFLAHYPDDLQDGTGGAGPYVHDFKDPEGDTIGQFSLEISGNSQCDVVQSIDIKSTGWDNINPEYTRTVEGRYSRPSVAEYAYILNSNVWAGSDRIIIGPYHSNGGIRMDGTNNSIVTSGLTDWLCTSSFGCSPDSTEDGVFGGGSGSALWSFPSPPIDFVGITLDLVNMKAIAQTNNMYFDTLSGNQDDVGYHFVFKGDGTVDVYEVEDTSWVWGYHSDDRSWHRDYHIIDDEDFISNYNIPSDCGLIYASGNVWIEGEISEKVTIAAANVDDPGVDNSMVINDDITYLVDDGSVGLIAVAEESILIPLLSPDDMVVDGIFIAQNGYFGRNYYTTSGSRDVPSSYNSYVEQNSLTITGSIVSNGRVGTKWTCGGSFCSGYENRVNSYDRDLAINPPPMTPYVSDDYRFVRWLEVE